MYRYINTPKKNVYIEITYTMKHIFRNLMNEYPRGPYDIFPYNIHSSDIVISFRCFMISSNE